MTIEPSFAEARYAGAEAAEWFGHVDQGKQAARLLRLEESGNIPTCTLDNSIGPRRVSCVPARALCDDYLRRGSS